LDGNLEAKSIDALRLATHATPRALERKPGYDVKTGSCSVWFGAARRRADLLSGAGRVGAEASTRAWLTEATHDRKSTRCGSPRARLSHRPIFPALIEYHSLSSLQSMIVPVNRKLAFAPRLVVLNENDPSATTVGAFVT
jgi:hypothetical protein